MNRELNLFFRHPHAKLIDQPSGHKVMVLAPHPDDDVIGCGGTMAKHALAGNDVLVVYVTDGSKGNPDNPSEAEVVATRRKEALRSTALLGIHNHIFLNFPDGALEASWELISCLTSLLIKYSPQVVYLPSILDNHPDHQALARAFSQMELKADFEVYWYEVWTPIPFPSHLVDISAIIDLKCQAIAEHRSQNKAIKYYFHIKGLNAYRAIACPPVSYAEAFIKCSLNDMRHFVLNLP